MKKIKMFENFQSEDEINKICKYYCIKNWTINKETGLVDVDGDVSLDNRNLVNIPLKFGNISGNFIIYNNKLKSLVGFPKFVGGRINISKNLLTSLEGLPNIVIGSFDCSSNPLGNLKGCPKIIKSSMFASNCKLTSLEGCPNEIGSSFDLSYNNLTSLVGCARKINEMLWIRGNKNLSTFNWMSNISARAFNMEDTPIGNIYKLFSDPKYLELIDFYGPVEMPTEKSEKPILHLDILNEFLEEIGKPKVTDVKGYKCVN